MKSYGQYCAVAKALDVVGDRWNLLIVRELVLQGPCRYTDLEHGLPGIASNLLSSRLRDLEAAGVIKREAAPPPVATTLFSLTEMGHELEPVLGQLGQWGARFIAATLPTGPGSDDDMDGAGADDVFRSHWLAFPVSRFFRDQDPSSPPVTVEVRTGDQPVVIERREGKVSMRTGAAPESGTNLALEGPAPLVVSVLAGRLSLDDAQARGMVVEGDPSALELLRGETRQLQAH